MSSTISATNAILDTVEIEVDASNRYQSIFGFGGAFTDSVGINLNKLSVSVRQKIIEQYYGEKGKNVIFQ